MLGKALDRLGALAAISPAWAQEGDDSSTPATLRPPEVQAAQVLGVYGRAVDLSQLVGNAVGVPVVSFWQPARGDTPGYQIAAQSLPEGVIDILDAFDTASDLVYLDGAHTNELGARLVAEAMYPHLRPLLVDHEAAAS